MEKNDLRAVSYHISLLSTPYVSTLIQDKTVHELISVAPRRGGDFPYAYTYEFSGKSDAENMNFPSTFSGFPGILH
jgi:hypothetical protein